MNYVLMSVWHVILANSSTHTVKALSHVNSGATGALRRHVNSLLSNAGSSVGE